MGQHATNYGRGVAPGATPAWVSGFVDNAITALAPEGGVTEDQSGFVDNAIVTHAVTPVVSGFVDNAIVTHAVTPVVSGFVDNAITYAPSRAHSSLTGLQGGTAGQYFHATEAELDALESSSSSGRLWGGVISSTVTPNIVNVAAGAGVTKSVSATLETVPSSLHDGQSSPVSLVTWDATQVTLAGVGYNIIFWDTSAGQFTAALKENFYSVFDFARDFTVGRVYYDGSAVTIRLCGMNLWNFARRVQMFGEERFPVERATGMMIAATTGLGFSITSGRLWAELVNPFSVSAFTTASNTFTYWYRNGSGGWTSVASQSAIDNLHYDDGSGTLATLGTGRHGVHWVYEVHNGSVHVVYGQGNYTQAQAEIAPLPSTLPGILAAYASMVGKIIVVKSASSLFSVQSPFTTTFTQSTVSAHNDLAGLQGGTTNEYYHLTNAELTSVQNFSGFVDTAIVTHSVTPTQSGWVDNAITTHAVTPIQSGWVDNAITTHAVTTIQSGWVDNAITTHAINTNVSGYIDNAITYRAPALTVAAAANATSSDGLLVGTSPGSSPGYSGTIAYFTYGESLTYGDIVYLKSDGSVWKADANAAGLFPACGLALGTYSSGSHKVLLNGIYRDDTLYNWTVGGVVYLSTTAGTATQTQPSATDDCIQILGIATHADKLYFNPQLTWITHT